MSLQPALARALGFGLALVGCCAAAQESPDEDAGRPGVQVFQRSRAGVEFMPALCTAEHGAIDPSLRDLARGTLLRAPLGEHGSSLTLRLRGRTLSLVWAVPLSR